MSRKFFITLFILLELFIIISSSEKNNSTNEENKTETFTRNPYFILRIAPWSKFKDVEARFSRLKDKAEAKMINDTQFQLYTKAYDAIKEEYIKSNKVDKTFFGVLLNTFKLIFFYELFILILLFITWLISSFTSYVAILVGTFVVIDRIIPHWFYNMQMQYLVSFSLGTLIYFRNFFCGKNENDRQTGRKKFQKIE